MANFNQETDPSRNREPGVVIVPGSNFAKEMAKFEQLPSKYTVETQPGNPYRFRQFPMMVYRAREFNGKIACMATPPDQSNYPNEKQFIQADESARRFTEDCQRTVRDEAELQQAYEMGYRDDPAEAVEHAKHRADQYARADAERAYEDRNMSDAAKAEIAAESAKRGGEHIAEMPAKPRARRKKATRRRKTA